MASRREALMQEGIQNILGGFRTAAQEGMRQEQNKRAQALQSLQFATNLQTQGYNVTPEALQQINTGFETGDVSGLAGLRGALQLTPEEKTKREITSKTSAAQLKKLEGEAAEAGRPFKETKEFEKFRIKEDVKADLASGRLATKEQEKEKKKLRDEMRSLDEADISLNNILKTVQDFEKKGKSMGPFSSRLESVFQSVGVGDQDFTKLRTNIRANMASYIKSISGAAVSDKERRYLETVQPSDTDTPEQIQAKVDALKGHAMLKRKFLQGEIGENDFNSGLDAGIGSTSAAVPVSNNQNIIRSDVVEQARQQITPEQARQLLLQRQQQKGI